ncbi:hypothetical protein K7X08_023250 [Anisodus acutangulus]|uniref:Retrotransposon gag domain-containing protein n=1 Tax=Anisodus acutangulus TaxID=402998 RepID=A0A9Q1QZ72_9SOLA|nr:hypothetical protein K7X08_023250 [Anisodus acutangulus]
MTEIMRVKHTGSVKDYQSAFDSVMTRINLPLEYAISIFLNHLKAEISDVVWIGQPYTLPQAYYLARLQVSNFAAQSKAIKGSSTGHFSTAPRGSGSQWQNRSSGGNRKKPVVAAFNTIRRRRLTPAETDEKRAQGLCLLCGEKFFPGHNCKSKRYLFSIEMEEGEETITEEEMQEEVINEGDDPVQEVVENCAMSLQAINGTNGYRTLRVGGFTKRSLSTSLLIVVQHTTL